VGPRGGTHGRGGAARHEERAREESQGRRAPGTGTDRVHAGTPNPGRYWRWRSSGPSRRSDEAGLCGGRLQAIEAPGIVFDDLRVELRADLGRLPQRFERFELGRGVLVPVVGPDHERVLAGVPRDVLHVLPDLTGDIEPILF